VEVSKEVPNSSFKRLSEKRRVTQSWANAHVSAMRVDQVGFMFVGVLDFDLGPSQSSLQVDRQASALAENLQFGGHQGIILQVKRFPGTSGDC